MASVLVVEDDVILRYTLAEWLRACGNEVFEAASGDEARTVLSTVLEIDLVVTDVQMPGSLDGLQLTRNLHATHPQIPVIVVSGLPLRADAESAGAAAFYPKPYNLEELAARIAELIAQRGPSRGQPANTGNG
jgi:two-component system, response regulator PdtaR